jgi:very-short-patch-repair endonuclease
MSPLESLFALHVRAAKLPEPVREFRFAPPRRFRFDFAWPDSTNKVAVEIDGGTWMQRGRHTTGSGYENDCEKLNLASLAGWRVFRFTGGMVKSGAAIATVIEALKESA